MTVLSFIHYTKRAQRARQVTSIENDYDQQCMRDLRHTLQHIQAKQDKINPGKGGGVAIAANQLQFPYQPISPTNPLPAPGFYPYNYVSPNIYLLHIRPERASLSNCDPCEPTFFINATMTPINEDEPLLLSGEACPSLDGFHGFNVPRYDRIRVQAQNDRGEWAVFECSGFTSRVHQHEIDFGRNIEYLYRLSLSVQEINVIKHWLNKPEPVLGWILPNKLECASLNPNVKALKKWVENHTALYSRVIIIGANQDLGLALTHYYLSKGQDVIATHSPQNLASPLVSYQETYPTQLTLKTLAQDNYSHYIDSLAGDIPIKDHDLIIYVEGDETAFLTEIILSNRWFEQLLKNNVFWVNINTSTRNTSGITHSQGHIQNMDNSLKIEWARQKGDVAKRPCAMFVYSKKKESHLKHASSLPNWEQIAENIVMNCINPVRQSKQTGTYYSDGLREKKSLQFPLSENTIFPPLTKLSLSQHASQETENRDCWAPKN